MGKLGFLLSFLHEGRSALVYFPFFVTPMTISRTLCAQCGSDRTKQTYIQDNVTTISQTLPVWSVTSHNKIWSSHYGQTEKTNAVLPGRFNTTLHLWSSLSPPTLKYFQVLLLLKKVLHRYSINNVDIFLTPHPLKGLLQLTKTCKQTLMCKTAGVSL